jgi:peptide/nickel transport system ATP-binding protein
MLDPRVIICDEPVSALDVSVQAQILNLLEDMKARYGLTLIFIAHDLAVVKNVSDRVAVMYLGKVCEVGPPDTLYEEPSTTTPQRCSRPSRSPTPTPSASTPAASAVSCRHPSTRPRAAGSAPAARRPRSVAPQRSP